MSAPCDSGFAVIPAAVLASGNGHAIAVYAAIAQHADREGVAFPSVKRLSEITGWSRPTIDKAIGILVELEVIVKERRFKSGLNQSNQYRLPHHNTRVRSDRNQTANVGKEVTDVGKEIAQPAYVPMETSLPTYESSLPLVGNDVSSGTQPGFHEQEPGEQYPEEQDSGDGPAAAPRPLPRHGPAQVLVATLYEDVLEIGQPTSYDVAVGQARNLVRAGCSPDELREIATWLLGDPFWAEKGITMGVILKQRDKWRAAQRAPIPIRRDQPANMHTHGHDDDVDWLGDYAPAAKGTTR